MINFQEFAPIIEQYLEFKWSLIPIAPETKVPPIDWGEFQDRRASLEEIKVWIQNGYWLAVVTGEISNFFVVDDDRIKHGLPEWGFDSNVISQSKSGGKHYYFKWDREVHQSINGEKEKKTSSNGGLMIDIKGWHNYVLLPPFNERKWIKGPTIDELANLPVLSPEVERQIRPLRDLKSETSSGLDLSDYLNVPDGSGRKDSLHSLACKLFYKGFSPSEVWDLVGGVNTTYQPPVTEKELTHNVETAYDFFLNNPITKDVPVDLSSLKNKTETPSVVGSENKFAIESLGELLERNLPPECWLVDKIIPVSGLSCIAGPSGVGKSFYSLTMAQSVATGQPWLGEWKVETKTKVLILDKENSELWRQKRARGLDMQRCSSSIYYSKYPELFTMTDGKGKFTEEAEMLSCFVKENGVGLIIFDSFVDFVEGDENSARETQAFFNNVRIMFPNLSISIIIHFNKTQSGGDNRPLLERIAGSRNIGAQLDGGIAVDSTKEEGISTFQLIKTRNSGGSSVLHKVRMLLAKDINNNDSTIVTGLAYEGETEVDTLKQESIEKVILDMCPLESTIEDDDSDEYVINKEDIKEAVKGLNVSPRTIGFALSSLKESKQLSSRQLISGHPKNSKNGQSHRFFISSPKQLSIVK